jgi:hypothetical protein
VDGNLNREAIHAADKLLFGSEDTAYGIVAHTPSRYAFHVTQLGRGGEIYGLLCPEHEIAVVFKSIICPESGVTYDVRNELIFMDEADAALYGQN